MTYDFRPKLLTFRIPCGLQAFHCIETKPAKSNKWDILTDETGIMRFESASERDAKIEQLKAEV